jgi:hypothetical protein
VPTNVPEEAVQGQHARSAQGDVHSSSCVTALVSGRRDLSLVRSTRSILVVWIDRWQQHHHADALSFVLAPLLMLVIAVDADDNN